MESFKERKRALTQHSPSKPSRTTTCVLCENLLLRLKVMLTRMAAPERMAAPSAANSKQTSPMVRSVAESKAPLDKYSLQRAFVKSPMMNIAARAASSALCGEHAEVQECHAAP